MLLFMLSVISPLTVFLIWLVTYPIEKSVSNWYINDAKKILKAHKDLIVIGVTGSYGKTTTKFILNRLLSEKYNVVCTPQSFNTPMGVVRTVRGDIKPQTQVFVCEMGAKNVGDIKEICDIANPSYGIITSVGPQHLETFKSVDITYTELGRCVGGIAGLMTGSADFCTNKAKIVGKDWVGGIAGAAEKSGGGSYYNLTNTGDVTGENYVGGIYGDVYNWTDGNWTYTVNLTNLSNSGSVSGVDYVGGLCGRIYGYNDYKSTKVVGSNLVNTGNVSGRDTVGGIAGYAYSDSGSSSISGCVNSGSVTGESLVADIVAKKNGVSFS